MIEKETQVRFIGYGAMLMESFVAVMAIIAASIIDPGLYYAMNAPAGRDRRHRAVGVRVRQRPRLRDHARARSQAAARAVEEETLVARTGGAPTLAIGMSEIFAGATGDGLQAFWYHFAIMFEALFILTTVDAGTRVGRFMLQDTLGNVYKPFREVSWKPGVWFCSAVIVGAWGYFLYAGVTNPLGGINQLFPLFGIANQLLAAVALTRLHGAADQARQAQVGVGDGHPAGLGRGGHAHRELPEGVQRRPEARLLRPARPVQGRDRQRARCWRPPRAMDDMHAVVTNSTVDGILAAFFAILIIIVIARRHPHLRSRPSARGERCPPPRCRPRSRSWTRPSGLFAPRARSSRRRGRMTPCFTRRALVPARGLGRERLRPLRRAPPARASGRARDVAARLRAPPPGRARGPAAGALLLKLRAASPFAAIARERWRELGRRRRPRSPTTSSPG